MKLYRTESVNEDGTAKNYTWDGTQADARATRKNKKECGHTSIETEDIDVPTDKAGLLEFLNKNCTGE